MSASFSPPQLPERFLCHADGVADHRRTTTIRQRRFQLFNEPILRDPTKFHRLRPFRVSLCVRNFRQSANHNAGYPRVLGLLRFLHLIAAVSPHQRQTFVFR